MKEERKKELITLLKEKDSKFNKAIIFYLTRTNYKKKTDFVERLVDSYMSVKYQAINDIYVTKKVVVKKIPQEIITKLVKSYEEDMALEQKTIEDRFVAETNEIF